MNPRINKKCLFLTWEKHRRTREIAKHFKIQLHENTQNTKTLARYLQCIRETIRVIAIEKPEVLFVQNPSIILSISAIVLRTFYKYKLIVDAHNEAVHPFILGNALIHKSGILAFILRFIQKNADLTIITNVGLERRIRINGGRPFVLPDKVPDIPAIDSTKNIGTVVTFICSYSSDEPILEVIEAAARLPKDVKIYITGNYKKWEAGNKIQPVQNLVFTGYLHDDKYIELLNASKVIMTFTTEEDCLLCGAYEALALLKPLITSKKNVLEKFFDKGAYHVEHDPEEISEAICKAIENATVLSEEMKHLKHEKSKAWESMAHNLAERINSW